MSNVLGGVNEPPKLAKVNENTFAILSTEETSSNNFKPRIEFTDYVGIAHII